MIYAIDNSEERPSTTSPKTEFKVEVDKVLHVESWEISSSGEPLSVFIDKPENAESEIPTDFDQAVDDVRKGKLIDLDEVLEG